MVGGALSVPPGWSIDDGTSSLGNVTPSGLGTVGISDLIIEHNLGQYCMSAIINQRLASGPASIQGFFLQHFDFSAANVRSNIAGNQLVIYNFLSFTVSNRDPFVLFRLLSV